MFKKYLQKITNYNRKCHAGRLWPANDVDISPDMGDSLSYLGKDIFEMCLVYDPCSQYVPLDVVATLSIT